MGGEPDNSAIDALLCTITLITNSISIKKTAASGLKATQQPAVLTYDIEGAFNQLHPITLQQVMSQR